MILILATFLAFQASAKPPASAAPIACDLLTTAQVNQATGVTVAAGTAISAPTSCQWAGPGKMVTLTINQPRSGKSPVEQFNAGKASTLPGVTVEPVSGVGDDAYYVYFAGTNRAGCGLVVKKGTSAFEIRIYGFDLAQAKTVAKTLAAAAAGKL
ncbi:MAG TPA: hypothetical protein VJN96_12535 [Vicinamibacterales bacterium]|nr:hypothetical protein [Vicinamibacterales bacterium]